MLESIFSWEALWWLMIILYVPISVGLVVVVLLQKGKGAGFAGAFGLGGGSDTVFGPRASKSLPVRLTQIMAGMFMLLALLMSIVSSKIYSGEAPEKEDPMSSLYGLEDRGIQGAASSATTDGADSADGAATPSLTVELPQESEAPAPPEGS
ncbi:MAG TPA: preprotein translocase subunit SecG [Candidatus Hydrogenedentes bacterium]|nr:preprotein translocase subunit SecG [Candidatus Hydrogenedentota bacterium]